MRVALDRPLDARRVAPGRRSSSPTTPSADVRDSLHARLSKAEGMLRAAVLVPAPVGRPRPADNPGDSQFSAAATCIRLDLTTDRQLVVAAPGRLLEARGRHRVYQLDGARDYAFVVAPRLHAVSARTRDGVRVRVFSPDRVAGKEHPAGRAPCP